MFSVINSPWKDRFFDYVDKSSSSIKICSPFVKNDVVQEIYNVKKKNTNLELVTNFNIANFYKGASDIDALDFILHNHNSVRNFQNLHAKIYIFDSKRVVITSSNLTNSGLLRNFEYGVVSDDYEFVKKVENDYDNILNNELSGEINKSDIDEIRKILYNLPDNQQIKFDNFNLYQHNEQDMDELLIAETKSIEDALSGWKLLVFQHLNKINKQIFDLKDLYQFSEEMHKKYPGNNNIEAKIRQQLQILRDRGLIKFLGDGRYKRLWW